MTIIRNFFLILYLFSQMAGADVYKTSLPETQLIEWKLIDDNFQIQLIQRLPDQTYGFFEARGFSKKIATQIANSCVFQTIIKNTSATKNATFSVSLKSWKIKSNNTIKSLKLKESWFEDWQTESIKPASHLAFRWATYPTQQDFSPNGDYNWGMISFGLKPGTTFDLQLEWVSEKQKKNAWIKNMTCAKNR